MSPFDFTFTPSRGPGRAECARLAREAVAVIARGSYVAPSGRTVHVADAIRSSVARTIEHRPEERIDAGGTRSARTRISIVNGTSLASARRIASSGAVPMVLNFASAKNPGGGFLNGARAQEESLARSSGLYACLEGREMYPHHRQMADCMYSSWMIWSPDVPVFRDDETGELLEEPYPCAFLTTPAPNASVVLERDPGRAAEVERLMRERVARSLAIAASHGHTHLVLGAWGCGVFGNDPAVVADAWRRELDGPFRGTFDEVVFAVLDWSEERRFIRPFVERLGDVT
jgi:uncharacterized protein (TIGR02452 family)